MGNSKKNYVLILASGGLDSTACINFYSKLKFKIDLLYIDYGQIASRQELIALRKISQHYNVELIKVAIKGGREYKAGMIQGRNAFLLSLALLNFKKENGTIACGIHYGTNYYDCSDEFVNNMQLLFSKYTEDTVKIGAPFLHLNKKEIFAYCVSENVPVELTYSCEAGTRKPCGRCRTCKDLKAIYASQD